MKADAYREAPGRSSAASAFCVAHAIRTIVAITGFEIFIAGRRRCPYWQTAQRPLTSVDVLQ